MGRQFDKKKSSKKRERKPVLVFSAEGKNVTESQYLMSFHNQHAKYSIHYHKTGHDTDPLGLLKSIEKYWKDYELSVDFGDKAYILLDIDCSKDRMEKILEAAKLTENAKFILSNPCFEIWFLFHYEYTTQVFQNGNDLIRRLKKYVPDYEKSLIISNRIALYLDQAIDNADRIRKFHERAGTVWPSYTCNPMTDVKDLIVEIKS